MTNTWVEWAIIAFIVLAIAYVVWKGGAANPMGTGRLSRKVGHLDATVGRLGIRVGHVESEVEELKAEMASKADIATLRAELVGVKDVLERNERGLNRIVDILMEKGLGK
jgi:hypothetical protein